MDDHINDVARQRTAAPAPHDLRRRVLARIVEHDAWREWRLSGRLAPVSVVAAVLAAGVVLGVAMWPAPQSQPASQMPPASTVSTTEAALAGVGVQPGPAPSPNARSGSRSFRTARTRSTQPAPVQNDVPSAIALLAPEPLAIAAISVETLAAPDAAALDPLEVTGLIVTKLEIKPIGDLP